MYNNSIDPEIILLNNRPLPQFLGLSPNEVYPLLHDPFNEDCPVLLRKELANETLDCVPFFRVVEDLLAITQREGKLKQTPLGFLQKKVLVELYEKKRLSDFYVELGMNKVHSEENIRYIYTARIVSVIAKLLIKRKGYFYLSKKAEKLMQPSNRILLFHEVFSAFTLKFNWGFHDQYPTAPVGQFGWAFTIYLLARMGDKPLKTEPYALAYLNALPNFIKEFEDGFYITAEQSLVHCYEHRTFSHFLEWFGIVERANNETYLGRIEFIKSPLVDKLFKILD